MESYSKLRSESWKSEEIECGQRLLQAAGDGNIAEVECLLALGVTVNAEEYIKSLFYAFKNYMTPLQVACEKNQYEVVKLLIKAGADINSRDRFDVTAVHASADKGHLLCLKELLDAGAECSVSTKPINRGCDAIAPYVGGTTPLHLAAASNQVECIIELIQAGADYNATDEKGRTSLYIAAQCGFENCLLAHLKNAIGRDILSLPSFGSRDTPLHFAVKNGMVNGVKELLSLGSDPNHVNISGSSPVHYAVSKNPKLENCAEAILKLLVLNGHNVDVNKSDGSGFTPLHYVCFNVGLSFERRPNLACFLIAYGANPLIKNQRGYNVIEHEMKICDSDRRILEAVVQSVLHVPPLRSLKINVPLPPRPSPAVVSFDDDVVPPLEQMLHVPEYLSCEFEHWTMERDFLNIWNSPTGLRSPSIRAVHHNVVRHTVPDPKHKWYALIASQPRSLQHYCRFQIRASLGYLQLPHVEDLHLPLRLQHYLLLQK